MYTFDYFQSVLLFDSYCLDIGIVKLKLDRHVNGQPLGIMAKHADGRYVYNFEIFHECLLPKSDQAPSGFKCGGETTGVRMMRDFIYVTLFRPASRVRETHILMSETHG